LQVKSNFVPITNHCPDHLTLPHTVQVTGNPIPMPTIQEPTRDRNHTLLFDSTTGQSRTAWQEPRGMQASLAPSPDSAPETHTEDIHISLSMACFHVCGSILLD